MNSTSSDHARSKIPEWLLDILACPTCGLDLVPQDDALTCGSGHSYPVRAGIPRFVNDDGYAVNFAVEWRQHALTQYDSTESKESAETFSAKTGLTGSDLDGKIVLDYGCGSGRFSDVATRLGARVVGLDLSSAIDVAAENLADRNFAGVQADALNPPFKKAAFDVVFSIGVLHHTPDCRRGVKEAARLVKPGGIVAIWLYWKGIRITPVTDLYRTLTKRIAARTFYSFCVTWVPRIARAHRLPVFGRMLRLLLPISNHKKAEWRVLDTFDWYSPKYQSKHDYRELEDWLASEQFDPIERLRVPVAVRGVRTKAR